jgi:hypothetical protein
VRLRFVVVNVAGLMGSEKLISTDPSGPLRGLETEEIEATVGAVVLVGR